MTPEEGAKRGSGERVKGNFWERKKRPHLRWNRLWIKREVKLHRGGNMWQVQKDY